jgi:hypothetical protein
MENELSKELMDIESELLQNAEEFIKIGDTLEKIMIESSLQN